MKFKTTNNNPSVLEESWPDGRDAERAADIINGILLNIEKFDLSEDEIQILEKAYDILFECAPYVRENLREANDVNLSDKSNSISGLLLKGKDKIDSATSQSELVKICSDLLAEKGGEKAQQFLSVLRTKKNHYAALKYVYDFILAGEGMRSPDSKRKSKSVQRREALQRGESIHNI